MTPEDDDADESPGPGTTADLPDGDLSLLRDLASAPGGLWRETRNHMLVHIPGRDRLVTAFDNLAAHKVKGPRLPWSWRLVQGQGWGMLGVMVKRADWFRCPELIAELERLRDEGLFASYPAVAMYGASMGGFGAATFAGLAPGCTVVAYAPQSTLSAALAPFETRYAMARRRTDWTGRYADAAEGLRAAARAYVVLDPRVPEDALHAARLRGPNVTELRWPHLGHKVPPSLLRMGVLKPMAIAMLAGELTRDEFLRLMRARRGSTRYLVRLIGAAAARHPRLALAAAERALLANDDWQIRKLRRALRQQLAGR